MTLVNVNNRPARVSNWVDELFSDFPTVFGKPLVSQHTPAVNVIEKENHFELQLEAPGYDKTDFKVSLEGDFLTISAEKSKDETQKDDKFIRREFSRQSFKRSFSLDEKIDASAVQGKYENGILNLILPKKAEAKAITKTIDIQ